MKRLAKFGLGAVAALAVSLSGAFAAEVTVGQFLMELAKVKGLAAADGLTAERSLRSVGVALPQVDLNKSLTEGEVARIATSAGIRVSTATPDSPFSQGQVDGFVQTFGDVFGSNNGLPDQPVYPNRPPREDPNPGKGKSKGFYKSPSEPI
jgi:hypothetical protein